MPTSVRWNYDVLIEAGLQPDLDWKPGVLPNCTNRSRRLLFEDLLLSYSRTYLVYLPIYLLSHHSNLYTTQVLSIAVLSRAYSGTKMLILRNSKYNPQINHNFPLFISCGNSSQKYSALKNILVCRLLRLVSLLNKRFLYSRNLDGEEVGVHT